MIFDTDVPDTGVDGCREILAGLRHADAASSRPVAATDGAA